MDLSYTKKNYINYINKLVVNKKISHSYLIEVDNYEEDFKYVMSFIKMILCDIKYDELETSNNNILKQVDDNNYPDIKIIEPDGSMIKKSQLLELQSDFSNTSLLDNKRIYIIKYAEKLNVASANTMLKFLEEPEENIIAFLITDNRYHVIETLISRCQILTLKEDYLLENSDENIVDLLKCFINKDDFFLKYNFFVNTYIVDKNIAKEKFTLIENIFINYLNYKYISTNLSDDFISILNKIDSNDLLNYLSIIEEELPKLDFNVNYKLWIDSLFSKFILGGSYD